MDEGSVVVAVTTAGDKAIAGPLVAAALVLRPDTAEPRFTWSGPAGSRSVSVMQADTTSLTRRQQLARWLQDNCLGCSVVTYTPCQLAETRVRVARQLAIGRAVVRAAEHAKFRNPGVAFSGGTVMVGGPAPLGRQYAGSTRQVVYRDRRQRPWPVWAAYLVARTHRDLDMADAAAEYPQYQFLLNFGYASTAHRDALETLGPTRHHRRMAPLMRDLENP